MTKLIKSTIRLTILIWINVFLASIIGILLYAILNIYYSGITSLAIIINIPAELFTLKIFYLGLIIPIFTICFILVGIRGLIECFKLLYKCFKLTLIEIKINKKLNRCENASITKQHR